MAKLNETNINNWYNQICEALDPDICFLEKVEQQKIIAILAKEKAERERTLESTMLFENLMRFI